MSIVCCRQQRCGCHTIPAVAGCRLLHFFEHIFLSEEVGSRKPQISFFEPVLQAAKPSAKKEILLIGDSLSSDIAGANRIGIDCV